MTITRKSKKYINYNMQQRYNNNNNINNNNNYHQSFLLLFNVFFHGQLLSNTETMDKAQSKTQRNR